MLRQRTFGTAAKTHPGQACHASSTSRSSSTFLGLLSAEISEPNAGLKTSHVHNYSLRLLLRLVPLLWISTTVIRLLRIPLIRLLGLLGLLWVITLPRWRSLWRVVLATLRFVVSIIIVSGHCVRVVVVGRPKGIDQLLIYSI
ncbi:hypothetical protein CPB85DRAFT_1272547 [Mucidula mucida]|nr:hypothetical protein CPB85DRAFT_1272547 [Mucidula mucida]